MSRDDSNKSTLEPSSASATGVYSFYLAGQWLTSPQMADVTSPFDQRVVGRVSLASPEHVEQAIQAAYKAFAVTRKLAAYERQKALAKIAEELTGRAEEFAQCISAEAGKPIRTARGEVERAAFCFQVCGGGDDAPAWRPAAAGRAVGRRQSPGPAAPRFRWVRSRRSRRSIFR